jgi:hypothetical protein
VLLLWKMTLECVLKKTLFMCSHRKKKFSMTTMVRFWLAYPKNASFLSVFESLRSHRA